MRRFALVLMNDLALSRWEIHVAQCSDVMPLVRRGAFAQILSAESPEMVRQTELGISNGDGRIVTDFAIMPCCQQT